MKFEEIEYNVIEWPVKPIIYFLIKDEEVVYVGQTINGYGRINAHTDKDFDYACYIDCPEYDLDNKEGYYIIKYNPKYNKALNKAYITIPRCRHKLNSFIAKEYNRLNLRHGYISKKKMQKLLDTEKITVYEYNDEKYINIMDLYSMQNNIYSLLRGAPVDEIYYFGV